MNTLIYVDKELAIAMAAKLVGLLAASKRDQSKPVSLNWLIQSDIGHTEAHGVGRDIRLMLPEDIVYLFYDSVPYKYANVAEAVKGLSSAPGLPLLPGAVVSISGTLAFPGINISNYDPFSPPEVKLPLFSIHAESCFVGRLSSDGFTLPVYFPEAAKNQVCFCDEEPVEIVGVVRWSPPYRPKGATSLNRIVRSAVVLLR